jgi:endonuclease/exonuclease/phosphatase family protein
VRAPPVQRPLSMPAKPVDPGQNRGIYTVDITENGGLMMPGTVRVSFLILILFLSATLWWGPGPSPAAAAPRPAPTVELRVMTLNIFYGGDELNLGNGQFCHSPDGCPETLDKVIEAIRTANPDVVGIEEGERSPVTIASALGWFVSPRMQIISRFPLIDPPGGDSTYIFVQLAPGRVAALMNVHLPADPYGPYLVRDGATADEVRALEVGLRLPAIQDQLRALPGLASRGIPVFLTGDFNSPSHLDWTPEVAAVRDVVRYPFAWPVGAALASAGFADSYRRVHPDPVDIPGFTWTPGGPESIKDEVHDRIDWVLAAGAATARESRVVGEVGGPDVGVAYDPWPTDHRGVVSTFDVVPGDAPILVAVGSRRVFVDDDLPIVFHSAGKRGERVGIVPAGGSGSAVVAARPAGAGSPTDGTIVFSTTSLPPGAYDAVLLDASNVVLSRSPFWLYAPGRATAVATSKSVYAIGEPIQVSWSAAPGNRWDWLGIYSPGESGDSKVATTRNAGYGGNGHYRLYAYTKASIEGTTTFDASAFVGYTTWPLQPGNYEIRLLLDDGYQTAATSLPFKVVQP